jgi:hypothetical protein
VKKIFEIDAVPVYAMTGLMPWRVNPRYTRGRRRHVVSAEWFCVALTPSQQLFLRDHGYTMRPHPAHNPTVEVFVQHENFTDRDWCLAALLF